MGPNKSDSLYFPSPNFCTKTKLWLQAFLILLIFIFASPILIAATLYRALVSKLGPLLSPGLTHILPFQALPRFLNQNLVDEIWCNVLVRFKTRGKLDFETLKARLGQRFVQSKNLHGQLQRPELQQYPFKWAGYYFWKWESKFDINEHIIHQTNDGGVAFTYAELDQVEQQFLKTSFASDKSPWIIIITDNIEHECGMVVDEPCFLVWLKFQHLLCDGLSLYNALMECADEKVPALELPTQPPLNFIQYVFDNISFPFRGSYEYARLLNEQSRPWPLLPTNQNANRCRQRQIVRSNPLEKIRIKQLALDYDVSFTAIVLAAVTGGIRNFLLQSNMNSSWQIPPYVNVEVPVPVENHPEGLSNSICVVTLAAPVGCNDIRTRIGMCEQSIADRKASVEPKLTYLLFNLQGVLNKLFTIPYNLQTVTFSIFPGPLEPVSFCGGELFEMSYTLLSVPHSIGLALLTYGDNMQFYCTGDDRVLVQQDLEKLMQCNEDEIGNMEKIVVSTMTRNGNGNHEELQYVSCPNERN